MYGGPQGPPLLRANVLVFRENKVDLQKSDSLLRANVTVLRANAAVLQKYTHSGTYGAPLLRGNMRFLGRDEPLLRVNNCILRVYFHFAVFAFCRKLLN